MSLLAKLKSLLGLHGESNESRNVGVTVEHDPEQDRTEASSSEPSTTSGDGDTGVDTGGSSVDRSRESTRSRASADDGTGVDTGESSADTGDTSRARAEADSTSSTTGADEAAGGDTTADDPADGTPVVELKGIGDAYAERLGNAGIESAEQLAEADAETLAKQTDISEGRLENWIEQAENR